MLGTSMETRWGQVDIVSSTSTLGRAGHAAVFDGPRLTIVGGRRGRTFFGDVLSLDTKTGCLEQMSGPVPGFNSRAGHSATLIGRHVWIIGGSNNETIFGDVAVFDLDRRAWSFPTLRLEAHGQL